MFDDPEWNEGKRYIDTLDLSTANLGDVAEALRQLEHEKKDLFSDLRVLRVRLAEEKVIICATYA